MARNDVPQFPEGGDRKRKDGSTKKKGKQRYQDNKNDDPEKEHKRKRKEKQRDGQKKQRLDRAPYELDADGTRLVSSGSSEERPGACPAPEGGWLPTPGQGVVAAEELQGCELWMLQLPPNMELTALQGVELELMEALSDSEDEELPENNVEITNADGVVVQRSTIGEPNSSHTLRVLNSAGEVEEVLAEFDGQGRLKGRPVRRIRVPRPVVGRLEVEAAAVQAAGLHTKYMLGQLPRGATRRNLILAPAGNELGRPLVALRVRRHVQLRPDVRALAAAGAAAADGAGQAALGVGCGRVVAPPAVLCDGYDSAAEEEEEEYARTTEPLPGWQEQQQSYSRYYPSAGAADADPTAVGGAAARASERRQRQQELEQMWFKVPPMEAEDYGAQLDEVGGEPMPGGGAAGDAVKDRQQRTGAAGRGGVSGRAAAAAPLLDAAAPVGRGRGSTGSGSSSSSGGGSSSSSSSSSSGTDGSGDDAASDSD